MENDLKVDSMLHRIVGILLDHPRSSWKCIDTNSLIFNNVEVEWLNSSLNTKKINQKVVRVFNDLNIYFEVARIKEVRILFIYIMIILDLNGLKKMMNYFATNNAFNFEQDHMPNFRSKTVIKILNKRLFE